MKKVLIINEGYSNNLGDQAIKNSITSYFKDHNYDTSFLYFSKPKIKKLPNYSYLISKKTDTKPTFFISKLKTFLFPFYWFINNYKTIKNNLKNGKYDLVVIGGGQLIISSGVNSLSGFSVFLYWFSLLIKRYSSAKLYLIGVGLSTKFNKIETLLFSKSLKKIDKIWVRDSFSQKNLKGIFKQEAYLMPDIAFYQKHKKKDSLFAKKNIALIGITNYNEVFLKYNKTSTLTKENYFKELYAIIKEYEVENCQIKLFYTTKTDALECLAFKDFIKHIFNNEISICNIENVDDLIMQFEEAQYVYSGRMHALILAMKSGCKVKPYLISQKLQSFNKEYIMSKKNITNFHEEINTQLKNIHNF